MKANTIKIEEPILNDIYEVKPKEQSLSAFVREAVTRDIRRRRMAQAATEYLEFLDQSAKESQLLADWESASLELPPKTKGRK